MLAGHFFVVVRDKTSGTCHALIDPSGGGDAFRSASAVSTSSLDLVAREGLGSADLSPETIVEYLNTGAGHHGRTFFPSITKLGPAEVVSFADDGAVTHSQARDVSIEAGPQASGMFEFFEQLAESLRGMKVSVDITGGIDSRLIATLLDQFGVEFETAISGWNEQFEDVRIGRQVAEALGRDHFVTVPNVDDVTEAMDQRYRVCDGLCDVFGFYRLFQHYRAKQRRGVELVISGIGALQYRDTWWFQDFPFYARKKSNLDRLIDLRLMPIRFPQSLLAGDCAEAGRQLRDRIKAEVSRYVLDLNTRSYDNIQYNYKVRHVVGSSISAGSNMIPVYAPLTELTLSRYGFSRPRRERFLDGVHRKTITRANLRVARIPTSAGGVSVSSKSVDLLRDVPKYFLDKAVRLAWKLKVKLTNRAIQVMGPDHPDLWAKVRALPLTAECVDRLVAAGVLAEGVTEAKVSDRHLGRLLAVGMLMKHLDEPGGLGG